MKLFDVLKLLKQNQKVNIYIKDGCCDTLLISGTVKSIVELLDHKKQRMVIGIECDVEKNQYLDLLVKG